MDIFTFLFVPVASVIGIFAFLFVPVAFWMVENVRIVYVVHVPLAPRGGLRRQRYEEAEEFWQPPQQERQYDHDRSTLVV